MQQNIWSWKMKMVGLQLACSPLMVQWLAQGTGAMGTWRALVPDHCPRLSQTVLCLLSQSSIPSLPLEKELSPLFTDLEERLQNWEIRTFIQTVGAKPFQEIWSRLSIFSWNAGTGELPPIKDGQWLVTPLTSYFLCFSRNALIGN